MKSGRIYGQPFCFQNGKHEFFHSEFDLGLIFEQMFDIMKMRCEQNTESSDEEENAMLQQVNLEMLAVCGADGSLRPLRFRFKDEDHQTRLGKVLEILSCTEIRYVNTEAYNFACRVRIGDREQYLDVRYSIRTHKWCLQCRCW